MSIYELPVTNQLFGHYIKKMMDTGYFTTKKRLGLITTDQSQAEFRVELMASLIANNTSFNPTIRGGLLKPPLNKNRVFGTFL